MYSFANLNNQNKDFINRVAFLFKPEIRNIGLANAIAIGLVLPTSEVENPDEFYIDNCFTKAREDISIINEITVVDVETVLNLIKLFWKIRYNVLYQRERIYVNSQQTNAMDFFGLGMILPLNIYQVLADNSSACITASNGYTSIMKDVAAFTPATV